MTDNLSPVQLLYIKRGKEQAEGQGARVVRTIGSYSITDYHDPFLLLDEFSIAPPAGFPNHPHRGFQTVTLALEGGVKHKDNHGGQGLIRYGGVQWMNAGSGVIHSEHPEGKSRGIQLWVNLKASDKFSDPTYQELPYDKLQKKTLENGATLCVIAGESHDLESQVQLKTKVQYTWIKNLKSSQSYNEIIPKGYQGFVYIISGSGRLLTDGKDDSKLLPSKAIAAFKDSKQDTLVSIQSDEDMEFIIVAGEKMNEPMARYGPFVMNTNDEIEQAFADYHQGKFANKKLEFI